MKRAIAILMMAMAAPLMAGNELSDAEAKGIAQRMIASIKATRADLRGADKDNYQLQVRPKLETLIKSWPEMNDRNRAIFPYHGCQQAALDLMGYADTFFLLAATPERHQWRERKREQFDKTHAECIASINNPDMSLKEIL